MKKINLNLPISNLYTQGPLKISQQSVPVVLELTKGEHVFTGEAIEIGTYFHYKVFAHISIPYSYDPDTQYVTIAGPDDISSKQLSIHTSLDQNESMKDVRSLNSAGTADSAPNFWTDFMNKNPDVSQVNKMVNRQAIDTLVQQLLDAGVQGVIQTGAAPIVSPDNYQDFKAMFMPEKADVDIPQLSDILEVQTVVFSTYWGTITWTLNYAFANVIGSTNDPKPYGYSSWIGLWADKCNGGYYPSICTSYNYSNGKTPFACGSDFVGGHVIPGKTASKVATGGTVYIFPICKAHNNNDNIYMSMRYNPTGVVLKNYNQ